MKRKRIMYVHGYNSDSNSSMSAALKSALYEVLGDGFDYYSPTIPNCPVEGIKLIERFVVDNDIEIIIGSSLGGFKLLHSKLGHNVKKIVINPLIDIGTILIKIVDVDTFEKCTVIGKNSIERDENLIGVFSKNDKVINSTQSVVLFQEFCSLTNPFAIHTIEDVHSPKSSAGVIAQIIVDAFLKEKREQ